MGITYKIRQILPIVYRTPPCDNQIHQSRILIHASQHQRLVQRAGHSEAIVTRDECQIVDGGVADDALRRGAQVERHVAHGDGHDGWIRDEGGALNIGLAGQGSKIEHDVGDVEAGEAVECCFCQPLSLSDYWEEILLL